MMQTTIIPEREVVHAHITQFGEIATQYSKPRRGVRTKPKPPRASARAPRIRDRATERRRTARNARLAAVAYFAGMMLGGVIPTITWDVAHRQVAQTPLLWLGVAGGLLYSAPIVATWFSAYVGKLKGWGFVLSLEVALTVTQGWTSITALLVLTALNAYVLGEILRDRARIAAAALASRGVAQNMRS